MAVEHDDEDFDHYGDEPVAPLSPHSNPSSYITEVNAAQATKPMYAASVVSSNIGPTTYFESYDKTMKTSNNESKCNRIYSYFNLLDFLLQFILIIFLIFEYFETNNKCSTTYKIEKDINECIGDINGCDIDNKCLYNSSICECIPSFNPYLLLVIIYIILTILILLHLIYRSCLICYAINRGSRNKKLFINGQVMHQIWMNRIADNCCFAFFPLFCCCCNNIATLAYFKSIDQYKTFPTTTALIINNIFKILNIIFCAIYIYMNHIHFIIIIIGILYIFTFIMSMNRIRIRRNAKFEKRRASITKHSV